MSWNELGAVALDQGELPLGENCYQRALAIHNELNQYGYLDDDWAGLARLKLAQGDLQSAREFAEQVMDYLHTNPRLDEAE